MPVPFSLRRHRHAKRALVLHAVLAGLLPTAGHAVIVGGTNGNGFNNAGGTTLNAHLADSGKPAFPFWDNIFRLSNSTGIYLGYNSGTNRGWVLSAHHIGPEPTSLTIAGQSYAVVDPLPGDLNQNGHRIIRPSGGGNIATDLVLYEIDIGLAAPPALPALPILAAPALPGDFLIMAGRGMRLNAGSGTEDTTAPFSWGEPSTSDAYPVRWGTNLVEVTGATDVAGAIYLGTDFDAPGAAPEAFGTAFDGQGAVSDSGGGFFLLRDNQWWLAGIMAIVEDGPDADALTNPAGYGDWTFATDTREYRSEILAITGVIPEPSTVALLVPAMAGLLWRRRRAS